MATVREIKKIILSADLLPFLKLGSITNSHTNNPNSERGKNWSKTMEKPKKNKRNKKNTPCHLSSFSSDPFMGRNFFFFFGSLEFFATLAQKRPKTHGKTKNTKNHKVSPHVTCPASPQTLSNSRNCLFVFLFFVFLVFLRFLQLCQSNNINSHFFVFFVFVFLGLLGEIFTLTNIHWHSFTPPHFILSSLLSY